MCVLLNFEQIMHKQYVYASSIFPAIWHVEAFTITILQLTETMYPIRIAINTKCKNVS